MTTQHQAPEVTSELRECPFCGTGCSDDHNAVQVQPYVSHGEWSIICECCQAESGIYMSKAEAITAWNTRATQPLSLTVDEETVARLRELLGKATPGPWQLSGGRSKADIKLGKDASTHSIGPDGDAVAVVFYDDKTGRGFIDGKLIVAAVEAIRAALAAPKHGEVE